MNWLKSMAPLALLVLTGLAYAVLLELALQVPMMLAVVLSCWFMLTAGAIGHFGATGLAYFKPSIGQWWYAMFTAGIFYLIHLALTALVLVAIPNTLSANFGILAALNFTVFYPAMCIWLHDRMVKRSLWEQQELEALRNEVEHLERDAKLSSLQHKLQPHFLFNALNSINALIDMDTKRARKMIQQLSQFMRGSINADDRKLHALSKELEHIQLYLSIEQVRFEHRLQVDVQCSEEAGDMLLPVLILQPLLENAIKFGLYGTTESVTISLNAWVEQGGLRIAISNPVDAEHTAQKGTGFGQRGANQRLRLIYGRSDLMSGGLKDGLYVVNLNIPQP